MILEITEGTGSTTHRAFKFRDFAIKNIYQLITERDHFQPITVRYQF